MLLSASQKLNKAATSCTRKPQESMQTYIERFIMPAQAYLNLANADRSSAESQNLPMTLMTSANLS